VRRSGSAAEARRTAVTARIRDAIRRIGDEHPELGRHLARSVRTGTFFVYEPDRRRAGRCEAPVHTVRSISRPVG